MKEVWSTKNLPFLFAFLSDMLDTLWYPKGRKDADIPLSCEPMPDFTNPLLLSDFVWIVLVEQALLAFLSQAELSFEVIGLLWKTIVTSIKFNDDNIYLAASLALLFSRRTVANFVHEGVGWPDIHVPTLLHVTGSVQQKGVAHDLSMLRCELEGTTFQLEQLESQPSSMVENGSHRTLLHTSNQI